MRTLAWSTFDAVVIVPEMPDGLAVAKALKLGGTLCLSGILRCGDCGRR